MVEQATGRAVWGVDGAQEAPGLREELSDGRGLHRGEKLAAVHAAEVGQVPQEINALRHDSKPGNLDNASRERNAQDQAHSTSELISRRVEPEAGQQLISRETEEHTEC